MAYSHKPFIIPVFLPHAGCPHRCVFCNQSAITGVQSKPAELDVRHQIERFIKFKTARRNFAQIAFFGGNFLGIERHAIKRLLLQAAGYVSEGRVDSIRFSTRPDTVDQERLDLIKEFPVSTIELGVQSMDDQVLTNSKRGHTVADSEKAIGRLKEFDYEIGVQLMVGLPGDSPDGLLASAGRVARLGPDFVRIYPTAVLAGSPLASAYRKGQYIPLSLDQAVAQTGDLYRLFKNENIPVVRMGLQANKDLGVGSTILAGPHHPAFGHLVRSQIFLKKAVSRLNSARLNSDAIRINVHPQSISEMRGLRNSNIQILMKQFRLKSVGVIADASLGREELRVESSLPQVNNFSLAQP
jgi:histone acetyltransferase (RNA polymerase elongator complex component)